MKTRKSALALALGVVVLLSASACSSSGNDAGSGSSDSTSGGGSTGSVATSAPASGGSADKSPIKIGAVATLTGVATFPDSSNAAKAVFDQVNASGGVNGHPIDYIVKDDGAVASQGTTAAHQLVESDHVVAMAGATSISDCATNGQYYQSKNIAVVQGAGIDAGCFNSPTIAAVNTGPYFAFAVALYYLSEVKHLSPVCLDIPNAGIPLSAYAPAVKTWEHATGKKLGTEVSAPLNSDPAPAMAQMKSAGCKGIALGVPESSYPSFLKSAKAAGLYQGSATFIGVGGAYSEALAKSLGSLGDGFYTASEFEPYTTDSTAVQSYLSAMKTAKLAPSSFGEGGYLAAQILVAALKTITGAYTPESVSAALKKISYPSTLLATPFTFSTQPNKSLKVLSLSGGKWTVADPDWITLK